MKKHLSISSRCFNCSIHIPSALIILMQVAQVSSCQHLSAYRLSMAPGASSLLGQGRLDALEMEDFPREQSSTNS